MIWYVLIGFVLIYMFPNNKGLHSFLFYTLLIMILAMYIYLFGYCAFLQGKC